MEENKETIEPKKSLMRTIFFIIYHLGLIGCLYGATINAEIAFARGHTDRPFLFLIALAIGIHLFASLLYKEYTRENK